MADLPKVEKSTASRLSKSERVRKTLLGAAIGLGVVVTGAAGIGEADASMPTAQNSVAQIGEGALLLQPSELPGGSTAFHQSHRSHYSHRSHQSHYSSRG